MRMSSCFQLSMCLRVTRTMRIWLIVFRESLKSPSKWACRCSLWPLPPSTTIQFRDGLATRLKISSKTSKAILSRIKYSNNTMIEQKYRVEVTSVARGPSTLRLGTLLVSILPESECRQELTLPLVLVKTDKELLKAELLVETTISNLPRCMMWLLFPTTLALEKMTTLELSLALLLWYQETLTKGTHTRCRLQSQLMEYKSATSPKNSKSWGVSTRLDTKTLL
jgi:hypothetical protein